MKIKPREKRERLFKNGRPLMRQVQFIDGEDYARDIKILWVAHTRKKWNFLPEDITQEEFLARIVGLSEQASLFITDDTNSSYREGKGPVAFFWAFDDGWKVEPHVEIFPWATKRNIIRSVVSFLHMMKYQKIGVCVALALKSSLALCEKCVEYGVLFRSGMVANGDPHGDVYIYSIRGKK